MLIMFLMQAQDVATEARQAGFNPDLHTYSSLIKGAVKLEDLDTAGAVFRDMLADNVTPSAVS